MSSVENGPFAPTVGRPVEPTPPPGSASGAVQPTAPPSHVVADNSAAGDDLSAMLKKAMAQHQVGNLGEAAMVYWAILERNPDHVDALHLGGLIAHETGDSTSGVNMIARAIELAPTTAIFHNNLGNVLLDCDEAAAATEKFRSAIALKPDFAMFHHNLGNSLHAMGQLEAAEAAYRHALDLQPDLGRAACALGRMQLEQGKLGPAEASFRNALNTDPHDEAAQEGLDQVMRQRPTPVQKPTAPVIASSAPNYGAVFRPAAPKSADSLTSAPGGNLTIAALRLQIAERLLRQENPDMVIADLMRQGVKAEVARKEVSDAAAHPYLQAGAKLGIKLKKRDWVLDLWRTLAETAATPNVVDRRFKLTRDEFLREYYSTNRPVIIQGMLDNWSALEKWTPEYLRENYGHLPVEIQANRNADRNYETNMQLLRKEVKFSEYIDMITNSGATNDFYMTANNAARNRETLKGLWNDIDLLPEYLDPDSPDKGFFWFGPAGTITPLHHDLTNNFMAQVRGRKHIKLIAAYNLPYVYNHLHCYSQVDLTNMDYERFPLMRNARILDVILEPREILFLPIGCWHYVKGLDISITMTFTHFRFNNDFHSFYQTYNEI